MENKDLRERTFIHMCKSMSLNAKREVNSISYYFYTPPQVRSYKSYEPSY